ncbi:MAG: metallophosphoesterase family protein [Flavobacteriales bacterium]|nr:metallophosphoesterase family protein [Flavobacteriales bacterium]
MDTIKRSIEGSKLLLFGGVYSNFQALDALQAWAKDHDFSPNQIVCTGDVVGYCAQPQECVDVVREWGVHCIAGNVEIQLRNGDDDCGCNFNEDSSCDLNSRNWYPFAKQHVNPDALNWMNSLPLNLVLEFGGKKWGVVHGSQEETAKFVYKSSPWKEKVSSYEALEVDHILAGHCGIPFADENEGHLWINSGALGMPANDGTQRVWFCVISKEGSQFTTEFHSIEYDFKSTQEKMKRERLPVAYIETLESGLWDSTEVLDKEQKKLTGVRIEFNRVKVGGNPS